MYLRPLMIFYISLKECSFIIYSTFLGRRRIGSLRFQLSDGLNKAEKGKTYTFNVRVKDLSIHLERHERYLFTLTKVEMAKKWNQMGFFKNLNPPGYVYFFAFGKTKGQLISEVFFFASKIKRIFLMDICPSL